ncbi:site-2 protease family protein, partial [Patescibacteria group bacterium]|nr:site-2 protease family protein [Patescibacteria group bacterium]
IVSVVGDAAELGIVSLLFFTAIISINLAVINILPIPALDGGRLLFLLIEVVKGSPLQPNVINSLHNIFFILLILLILLISYNDILRIIGG